MTPLILSLFISIDVCNGLKASRAGSENGSQHQQSRANSVSGPPLSVQDIIPPPQDFGGEYSASLPKQNNGNLYSMHQQQQTEYRSMHTQVQSKVAGFRAEPQGCAKSYSSSGLESESDKKGLKTSPN